MTDETARSHGRLSIRASLIPRDLMSETPNLVGAWRARIITLFPEAFPGVLGESLTGKALQEGRWTIETIDLRLFGEGRHRNVDDTPAGGGAGMVLRPDVVARALDEAARDTPADRSRWPVALACWPAPTAASAAPPRWPARPAGRPWSCLGASCPCTCKRWR